MAKSFGAELRELRKQRGMTQAAVAQELAVDRASIAQWETDRHLPSPDNVRRIDAVLEATGALVSLADELRGGPGPRPTTSRRRLASVLTDVADALVDRVATLNGTPLGWGHLLTERHPTPLSTAYVMRTLQLLDDARVDQHALAKALVKREGRGGWSNFLSGDARPEVSAVVLAALARTGQLDDLDAKLGRLREGIDDFARSRPYILATVLDCLLSMQSTGPFVDELVTALLSARTPFREGLLWAADAGVPARLTQPSLAHTARAVAALHRLRDASGAVDEAVESAVDWIVDSEEPDNGITERLQPEIEPGFRQLVAIDHFTAAWCLRALVAADNVPEARLRRALDELWSCYDADLHLWVWKNGGAVPSWMTHDAVTALHALAIASLPTPVPQYPETDHDPDSSADA
ncbi:MAG: helix-turn-helix domain-containing protein [Candidatus Nanopelagicales bacterium]